MTRLHDSLWDVRQKRPLISEQTRLGDVPAEWLEKIEPFISRRGFGGCWVYHRTNLDRNGNPYLRIKKDDGSWTNMSAAKYVARIFWDFPDGYFVKRTCEYSQCLNPNHIYVCPNAWGH